MEDEFDLLRSLVRDRLETNRMSIRAAAREIGIAHTTLVRVLDGKMVDYSTMAKINRWIRPPDNGHDLGVNSTEQELANDLSAFLGNKPGLCQTFRSLITAYADGSIQHKDLLAIDLFIRFVLSEGKLPTEN